MSAWRFVCAVTLQTRGFPSQPACHVQPLYHWMNLTELCLRKSECISRDFHLVC